MTIKVCLAGATGWAGSELARGIAGAADLALVAAVSRKHAGHVLGEVLSEPRLSAEVIFGMPDQRLTIRHDSGGSARPYVDGALLAIRKVTTLVGVHRGLDSVLQL